MSTFMHIYSVVYMYMHITNYVGIGGLISFACDKLTEL